MNVRVEPNRFLCVACDPDERIVFDRQETKYHLLRDSAARLWDEICEGGTFEVTPFATEGEDPVAMLAEAGLLGVVEAATSEGLTRRVWLRRTGKVSAAAMVLPLVATITTPRLGLGQTDASVEDLSQPDGTQQEESHTELTKPEEPHSELKSEEPQTELTKPEESQTELTKPEESQTEVTKKEEKQQERLLRREGRLLSREERKADKGKGESGETRHLSERTSRHSREERESSPATGSSTEIHTPTQTRSRTGWSTSGNDGLSFWEYLSRLARRS